MKITILEEVKKMDIGYRKERGKYHIRKFNSYYERMNTVYPKILCPLEVF